MSSLFTFTKSTYCRYSFDFYLTIPIVFKGQYLLSLFLTVGGTVQMVDLFVFVRAPTLTSLFSFI